MLTVIDSTIANNTSAQGGGIMSWSNAGNTATVINSTITGNDGGARNTVGGGLLAADGGTISVENSIVAGNTVDTPSPGTPSNCGESGSTHGTITSLGYNLESAADCGFTSTGDLHNTDPQLATSSPQNNGGDTDTIALAFVSPTVDHIPPGAPGCDGSDQRGVARPQGSACDIGAVEFVQPSEGAQFSGALVVPGCGLESGPMIEWGDGTSSNPPSAVGPISGSHTYAEEGTYAVTVRWGNDCHPNGTSTSFQLRVPDAPLTTVGTSVMAVADVPVATPVATFTDADPGGTASDYTAMISWGDGSVSAGIVTSTPGGFQVTGPHSYANGGSYGTTISVTDSGGSSAVAHGTVTVTAPPTPVSTGAPPPVVPGAPTAVVTGTPPSVGGTSATFTGSVNPDGLPTTAFFQYVVDSKYTGGGPLVYNQSTPVQFVGSDFTTHQVSASVIGLGPNVTYHVRLVAINSAGTTFGPDIAFNMLKTAPPGPPALGKTVNISPVSGVVLILIHGQLIPITELQQIPTNTVIDALHGTITLTIALNGGSGARDAAAKGKKRKIKTQTGTFGGAVFKITQAHDGLATLKLVEGAAFAGAPTYATCKAHKAADATAAALSSKTLQLLRSSAHGKFRTTGRYSAATVRGTKWTIADRCDGTLTHDITDSVVVTDFVRHKTIILHAGQSYLAKARR